VEDVTIEREKGVKWIMLISDTHLPTRAREIPQKVWDYMEKVDLVIHAGDFVSLEVVERIEEITKLVGVCGNMDFTEVRERLPPINFTKVSGKRIGVIHDAGIFTTEKMERIAKEKKFDILVFGHTHKQFLMEKDGITYVNPGSPTNPIPFSLPPSFALMKMGRKVEINFVKV